MKTLILIASMLFLVLGSYAQQNFELKLKPPIDFNSGVLAPDSSYLLFGDKSRKQDFTMYFEKIGKEKKDVVVTYPRYNMPVVEPKEYIWNMPIVVPDSTVNYAIRIVGAKTIDTKGIEKPLGSK